MYQNVKIPIPKDGTSTARFIIKSVIKNCLYKRDIIILIKCKYCGMQSNISWEKYIHRNIINVCDNCTGKRDGILSIDFLNKYMPVTEMFKHNKFYGGDGSIGVDYDFNNGS